MAVPARILHLAIAAALVLPLAPAPMQTVSAQIPGTSTQFGTPGFPMWTNYEWDGSPEGVQEPSVGVGWDIPGGTDANGAPDTGTSTFYQAFRRTFRLDFDDSQTPPALMGGAPVDITDLNLADAQNNGVNDGVDPILFTDYVTGRTFAGSLHTSRVDTGVPAGNQAQQAVDQTGCAVMSYTDGNGDNDPADPLGFTTWTAMTNPCSLPGWDHQTVASGPYHQNYVPTSPTPVPGMYPNGVYYCSQDPTANQNKGMMFCWVSEDGGLTFRPASDVDPGGVCQGLHGKMRIAPDGTAYLPNANCSGLTGFAVTQDFGRSWAIRSIPYGFSGSGVWDPSVAPTKESGWIYVAQAEQAFPNGCVCVALSKDGGLTWEDVGQGNGAAPGTKYFDVSQQLVGGCCVAFANVVAGDDERAAVTFLATTAPFRSNQIYQCGGTTLHWKLYAAMTYDAGRTWTVTQVDNDLVQNDGLYAAGTSTGPPVCRNHLDFYDSTVDRYGRVLVGYTDGCTGPCAANGGNAPSDDLALSVLGRQTTGCGLFEAFDVVPGACTNSQGVPPDPCGTNASPEVWFESPVANGVYTESEFLVKGTVDRHFRFPTIYAHTSGAYTGTTFTDIPILGWATCGTGKGKTGTFACEWTDLGGAPTFVTSNMVCQTKVNYRHPGSYPLQLKVTDNVSGYTGTIVTMVTVTQGGGGGGGPNPPPPPPPGPKCVDQQAAPNGPEPDADAFLRVPLVIGLGVVAAEDAWEIQDLCAQDSGTEVELSITTPADHNGAVSTGDVGVVLYEFYVDGATQPIEVCGSAANGILVWDYAAGAALPSAWATIDMAANRVTLELPYPNAATTSILTTNPHTVYVTTLEGECSTGTSNRDLGIPNDRAPDGAAVLTMVAPSGGGSGPTLPVSFSGFSPSGIQVPSQAGPGTTMLLPAVGNAATSLADQATGLTSSAAGSANGLAQGALGTAEGTIQALPVPGAAAGVQQSAAGLLDTVGNTLDSVTRQIQSLNLASVLDLLNANGNTRVASAAAPALPQPAGQKEYVRVAFDWGLTAYQPVYTMTPGDDNDTFGFTIVGVDASLNGLHQATVTWFDDYGKTFLAMDNVTFTIQFPGERPDEATPKSPVDPEDTTDPRVQRLDGDLDGIQDVLDNCPLRANPAQADLDLDGVGDVCDPDADGDGIPNGIDNCPVDVNADQRITHFPNPNGIGDACNEDWDNDGIRNVRDICPQVPDPQQLDANSDGIGDACDPAIGLAATGGAKLGEELVLPRKAVGPGVPDKDTAEAIPVEASVTFLGSLGVFVLVVGCLLVVLLALLAMRRRDP